MRLLFLGTTFLLLLSWSFGRAWTRTPADFPSYYTAAHLVLQKQPLREFYEMSRFQRHIDALVVPSRPGGYIPQTPLTMLPFVPLTGLAMEEAKQLWLVADLVFLAGTIWLLTKMTRIGVAGVLGLFVLGAGSLYTNLLLGQYYIFLLFLLTAAGYLLVNRRDFLAGMILGVICSLKLITIPFLLYFLWRKQWRVVAGMCVAIGLSALVGVILFSWSDLTYYFATVFPRSVAGETLDPFNPGNGTMTTLLRRLFVREPELNPASPFDSPPLFTLLRVFLQCMILGIALIAFGSAANVRASYAGFVLTLIVLSPNTASYTFLLLVLPTALLLEGSTLRQKIALLLCFFAVAIPMRPSWSWLFPKVWLLGVLFVLALLLARIAIGRRQALIAISTAAALSLAVAGFTLVTYGKETNRRWQRITVAKNQIGRSNTSPDGRWMVFAQESSRSTQIYLLDRKNGHTRQVTHGDCNSFAPAWERNFAAIVFASDCGRGLGMPAHYRAALTEIVKDS